MSLVPIFDLDGTLLDSDEALLAPFVALGIDREHVRFGLPLAEECERLGVPVDRYLEHYDTSAALPYPGVAGILAGLDRWAVCSNKHPLSGRAELDRLGWRPDAAVFVGDGSAPKSLRPVLEQLDLSPDEVLFVGDTAHDRACAREAEVRFVLAAWNPRAVPQNGDVLARHPAEITSLLG